MKRTDKRFHWALMVRFRLIFFLQLFSYFPKCVFVISIYCSLANFYVFLGVSVSNREGIWFFPFLIFPFYVDFNFSIPKSKYYRVRTRIPPCLLSPAMNWIFFWVLLIPVWKHSGKNGKIKHGKMSHSTVTEMGRLFPPVKNMNQVLCK